MCSVRAARTEAAHLRKSTAAPFQASRPAPLALSHPGKSVFQFDVISFAECAHAFPAKAVLHGRLSYISTGHFRKGKDRSNEYRNEDSSNTLVAKLHTRSNNGQPTCA